MSERPPLLVELNPDHPGFRDAAYRRRRDEIAAAALAHRSPDPAPIVRYTEDEAAVWSLVLEQLTSLHAERACTEHREAWPALGFSPRQIPQLVDVSRVLSAATDFVFQPVGGLVTPRVFMEHLADGIFLATQYMRHHSRPLYTPEPDVIHELVGHAALLTVPRYARINRLFGEATRRADEVGVQGLIRVYWYALEFGLVRQDQALRALGAGLLSSIGELEHLAQITPRPFSIEEIVRTPFDPTQYQSTLFVADSADEMFSALEAWLRSR